MNTELAIKTISSKDIKWSHVQDLPCVHTFHKDFYINLCLYHIDGTIKAISLNVDNIRKNENDIVDDTFTEETLQFKILYPIYQQAISKAELIKSGSVS